MRHLALLAVVYLLAAALVLPGSLLASEEPAGSAQAQARDDAARGSAQPAPAESPPTTPAPAQGESTPPETTPSAPETGATVEPAPEPATTPADAAPAPEPAPTEPGATEPAAAPADEKESDAGARKRAKAAASASVTIKDFEFSPTSVTIDVGDTVTWNNDGPTPHSATANDGSFDTGIYGKGESRSETFEEAGTFSYFCTPHPFMKASVTVRASDSGSGDDGGSAGGTDTGGSTGADDSGASGSDADDGSSLPATGRDSGTLLVLGVLMLALGLAVHRRARSVEVAGDQ